MRSDRFVAYFLAALAVLALAPPAAFAQYDVPHAVMGGGGGISTGSHIVYGTVGQPMIGIVTGPNDWVKGGFWYLAEISSTVDVAIAMFYGELLEDAVILTWAPSAGFTFEGFNVYRSETTEEAFERINVVLVTEMTYRDETAEPGKSYLYRIGAVDMGKEIFSPAMTMKLPARPLTLYQNYPNPFNPSTSIVFYNPQKDQVSIIIYDVKGSRVRTLLDSTMPVGKHVIPWNGTNDGGNTVGSGVYYYRLTASKKTMTRKMVVVR
jgi:hypothetical protein